MLSICELTQRCATKGDIDNNSWMQHCIFEARIVKSILGAVLEPRDQGTAISAAWEICEPTRYKEKIAIII